MSYLNKIGSASEGVVFVPFLVGLALIALFVALPVYAFFGEGNDSRFQESKVLMERVVECFKENNFFEKNFNQNKDEFFKTCRLEREVLEDGHHLVYIKNTKNDEEFFVGVYDFTVRCKFEFSKRSQNLPGCFSMQIDNYEFLVGSDQDSRRFTE